MPGKAEHGENKRPVRTAREQRDCCVPGPQCCRAVSPGHALPLPEEQFSREVQKMKKMWMNHAAVRTAQIKNHQGAEHLRRMAACEEAALLQTLHSEATGLTEPAVLAARETFGENRLIHSRRKSSIRRFAESFADPFSLVLMLLAAVSVFTDIIYAAPGEKSYGTVAIITVMVAVAGTLRFVQESRSGHVAEQLTAMIHTTACVERAGYKQEMPMEEIVVGDIVHLAAGDMIPADLRILQAKDLFISQSALTGESEPVEKTGTPCAEDARPLAELPCLAFQGSNVISGSARAVVLAVGGETMFGSMARTLDEKPAKTAFDKGIGAVSRLLIRFMVAMVPLVLLLNGFTKGNWMQAALFAISVAVGLTPEMLPMIVTTSLAKGALAMSKQKVIIKNLNAIQNLGAMNILCTDKTGTLTQDKVVLEYHLDVDGRPDDRVLRHAFLNSYFQTGMKNLIDLAVLEKQRALGAEQLIQAYRKVDEVPFDFERRRMSVVVSDTAGKTQMVTKGAVEEMLACCAFVERSGQVLPLTPALQNKVLTQADSLNAQGMRVIAVAQKNNPAPVGQFSAADEREMVLIGFLAFLDPPKETAAAAIRALHDYGVQVKVLTGDNEKVTAAICAQVGLPADRVMLGTDLDVIDDQTLAREAERVSVFAKLSPNQKARVLRVLQAQGHCVGYMGDGINDAAALKAADVGISVDTAVDIAKESAAIVLLDKDLMVLEHGLLEGRKTYANMMKYIKMTVSSNFGNMLSVLAASAFLPFLPMTALQLILLNLVYDLSCTALSWDHVDPEVLRAPCRWDAKDIGRFMLWNGPVSSVLDGAVFALMMLVFCPARSGGRAYHQLTDPAAQDAFVALFQTGWFVASMWTQTLVIHMVRTAKLPFVQSRASAAVTALTLCGIAVVTALPFTPLAPALGLTALPPAYFAALAGVVAGYILLASLAKKIYRRRFGSWI